MAQKSALATVNGHAGYNVNSAAWGGYGTGDTYFGKNSSNYYPYILKFTTPSFTGASTSIEFSVYIVRMSGATVDCKYAICSSDSNKNSYVGKYGNVTDANQIVSGDVTFSGLSGTSNKSFAIDAKGLAPNTTYYLFLWAANSSTSYAAMDDTTRMSVTVYYVTSYKLTISAGTGSTIAVSRTSSPASSTGTLSNGATIYDGDVLMITFIANSGYEIETHTVNGTSFASGGTHTVAADVAIVATAKALGLVYIDNGTTLEAYMIYIDNGSSWDQYVPYIDNGSGWDMCG